MSFNSPCIEREREGRKNQSIAQCHQYTYHSFQYHIHSKAHHNTSSNATSWPRGPNTAACPQRSSRRRSPHTMASWSLFDDECRNNPKKTSPATNDDSAIHQKETWMLWSQQNPSLYIIYLHLLKQLFHILSPITGFFQVNVVRSWAWNIQWDVLGNLSAPMKHWTPAFKNIKCTVL